MSSRRDGRLRSLFPGTITLLALLTLSGFEGLMEPLSSLRGEARADADEESERNRARGYYEGLIDGVSRHQGPRRGRRSAATAPPGWVTFEDAGFVEPDPGFLVWRFRKGLDVRWNGTTFRTNARGFRGPEFETTKPPGTYRVVVVGSSNTLAQGVDDGQGYVRLLEGWLAERAGPGRRVEVINLAVSGYGPTQRLHLFLTEVGALGPDWVLCDASALDLYLEELHLHAVTRERSPIPYPFVASALAEAGVSPADSPKEFGHKFRSVHSRIWEGTFALWEGHAQALGVPVTFVVVPRSDRKADNRAAIGVLRDAARRHGFPCWDLSDAFDDRDIDAYRVAPWEGHPNPAGHRRIFERLRAEVERSGGAPGLTTRAEGAR